MFWKATLSTWKYPGRFLINLNQALKRELRERLCPPVRHSVISSSKNHVCKGSEMIKKLG